MCSSDLRDGELGLWEYGFEGLLILLESGRVDVRHVVRENLHPAFMRESTGKNGIDSSVHSLGSWVIRLAGTDSNQRARRLGSTGAELAGAEQRKCGGNWQVVK